MQTSKRNSGLLGNAAIAAGPPAPRTGPRVDMPDWFTPPDGLLGFWDAGLLKLQQEDQSRVTYWQGIYGDRVLRDAGEPPLLLHDAMDGAPGVRRVPGGRLSVDLPFSRGSTMHIYMVVQHAEDRITYFDVHSSGGSRGTGCSHDGEELRVRSSGLYGGHDLVRSRLQPPVDTSRPYLFHMGYFGDAGTIFEMNGRKKDKHSLFTSKDLGIGGDSIRVLRSGDEHNITDLGMLMVIKGGITDEERQMIERWAGARFGIKALGGTPGKDTTQGGGAGGSLSLWLLIAALGGAGAYAYRQSQQE